MKKTFVYSLIILSICATVCADAQQARHRPAPMFNPGGRPAELQTVLAEQVERALESAKPTAIVQRMVAEVGHDSATGARDSFRFFYFSLARGAAHTPKNAASYYPFDFYPLDTYDSTSAGGGYRTQYMKFDSVRRYDFAPSGSPAGSEMLVRNQYNAANHITKMEHYENGPTAPTRRYLLNYNAAGDAVAKMFYDQSITGLALSLTQTSQYNAQRRPTMDSNYDHSGGVVGPDSRVQYTYTAAGQLAQTLSQNWSSGMWQPSTRRTYNYNAAGLIRSHLSEEYNNGAWTPSYKDSFVYAGTNPAYTANYGYEWNSASGSWVANYRTFAHLNAAGNWDTVRNQYYDTQTASWGNLSRMIITYNSYNNWETFTQAYDDNDNGAIGPGETYGTDRYYYELWDNSTADVTTPSLTGSFHVYPNPASTSLIVRWSTAVRPASYVLADLNGRVVSLGSVPAEAEHTKLDIADQAPGIYILTLRDNSGAILHREKVVRQ